VKKGGRACRMRTNDTKLDILNYKTCLLEGDYLLTFLLWPYLVLFWCDYFGLFSHPIWRLLHQIYIYKSMIFKLIHSKHNVNVEKKC
jgi:hypothetical protein